MTFSARVKAELCRTGLNRACCAAAEAYGVLLYANTFSTKEIKIITASPDFAQRLPRLWKRAFGADSGFDAVSANTGSKTVFFMQDAEKIRTVFARYGYDAAATVAHHINLGMLEEDCCRVSFLRGAYLAGGSITDPEKGYHLELVTDHKNVSGEMFSILLELGFSPKDTMRAGHYVIYFKQSEAIEDFFTLIGAPNAAMEIMSAKVEKDMRNAVNRRVNCDSANADKIVSAAQAQLEQIRKIERETGLENLPEDLREVALLRIANPEASLADLALLSPGGMSKSGINHRMRKLMAYKADAAQD
ncbi:MAG: DNA-binding protein WhiA [Oscillospiraceae bacterium]|nr:DNA-binding protein WhiA [Oscillospiraceae bacterium]